MTCRKNCIFWLFSRRLSFTGSFLQSCIPKMVNGGKRKSTVVAILHDVTKNKLRKFFTSQKYVEIWEASKKGIVKELHGRFVTLEALTLANRLLVQKAENDLYHEDDGSGSKMTMKSKMVGCILYTP